MNQPGVRRYLQETRSGYLHIRAVGEGGTPLGLLHVTPHSSLVFRRLLPLLGADRLVVAVDRLGFGFSDPAPAPCNLADYALATLDALDGLVRDPALKDAVAFLVPLDDNAGKAVRINITARQKQIEEIDRRAQAAGLSRSAYIVQAALRPSKRAA